MDYSRQRRPYEMGKAGYRCKLTSVCGEGSDDRLWWVNGVQGRYVGESLFDRGGRKAAGHHHVHEHGMDPFEWAGACQKAYNRLESEGLVWLIHTVCVLKEQVWLNWR